MPWGLAPLPDGRILITERPGRIRVLGPQGLDPEPWATLDVHAEFGTWGPESGLLGVAVAPDFESSREIFVIATQWRTEADRTDALAMRIWRRIAGAVAPGASFALRSRVIRFTERDGRGTDPTVVIDDLPAYHYHAGGGLAFGPDARLYVSIGDATRPAYAPEPKVLAGKLLRYERDGGVPEDNPRTGSPVWSSGLRNSQSFDWIADSTLIAVDHGPTLMPQERGRSGQDELNILRSGSDHGWPRVSGWSRVSEPGGPIWVWRDAIAPAGIAVHGGPGAPSGDSAAVFVAGLRGGLERLLLVRTAEQRWQAVARDQLLGASLGRLRAAASARDGTILVTTSNRDARGRASPLDDVVLRLHFARGGAESAVRAMPVRIPDR